MKYKTQYQEITDRLANIQPVFSKNGISVFTALTRGDLYMWRIKGTDKKVLAKNAKDCLKILPSLEADAQRLKS